MEITLHLIAEEHPIELGKPDSDWRQSMLRRIGIWALCGFAVALIWVLVFYSLGPSGGQYLGQSAVLRVTAPVALLGRHHAITWYGSAVINAAIYAGIGLAVETIRLTLRFSLPRLRH